MQQPNSRGVERRAPLPTPAVIVLLVAAGRARSTATVDSAGARFIPARQRRLPGTGMSWVTLVRSPLLGFMPAAGAQRRWMGCGLGPTMPAKYQTPQVAIAITRSGW